jgi:hypothetical protein
MKRTIYLPEALDRRLAAYVRRHRGTTPSSVVQAALEAYIRRPDPREILRLAGIAGRRPVSVPARERAEDTTIGRER